MKILQNFVPIPFSKAGIFAALAAVLTSSSSLAATATVFTEDFESYSDAATAVEDTADANPTGPKIFIQDDAPVAPFAAGTGVQLVNWAASSGDQALLVRGGSEAILQIPRPLSGSSYQLDFQLNTAKGSGDRNFYMIVRAMGSDTNGEDFMAYRSDRAAGNALFYYDGILDGVGWVNTGAQHADGEWQHHRFVFNMRTLTFDLYINDMENPAVTGGDLSRPGAAVPTAIRLINEGNSEDDGYFLIDDLTLTVEDSVALATTFREGFESYPAAAPASAGDDADPQGPWITNEEAATAHAHGKVQVVDTGTVTPHGGSKALKLEGGPRAGATFAWGSAPHEDVQVTWWARVPMSVDGTQATYLRVSLYGIENGRSDQGDSVLLGYGSRREDVGDETSLTIFTTDWQETSVDYTPDTWEEYRLITHVDLNAYSIIKNPSSENPEIIADRAPFIGAPTSSGPNWMVAFSSSNGTGHPPVYVDDIEVVSITSSVEPLPDPYEVTLEGERFSHVSTLTIGGPIGDAAVDPRDNSTIFFTLDTAEGGIYRATKVSPGTWEVDETPVVTGIDRPSGLVVDAEGTLWWTHDYGMRLMRLKAPHGENTPEIIISNFGPEATDDDPIDVTIAPSNFANTPNYVVVADRGTDGDDNNTLFLVDPATTELDQTGYQNYLIAPSNFTVGGGNLNAIAPVPASGEVAVINNDAFIYLADGNGNVRSILPNIYADPFVDIQPVAIGVDPTTSRVWLADGIFKQIWSISTDATPDEERLEVGFALKPESRPDSNIAFHDPGLEFSADGSILVVTDGSTGNGGGRLHIFHDEEPQAAVTLTSAVRTAEGFELDWTGAEGATYRVQRVTNLGGQFQDISGDLTATEFTDDNPPADHAFYRVVVMP